MEYKKIDKGAWISLSAGFVLTIIVYQYQFIDYIFRTFIVLIHELGHAMAAWLFGSFAIPSFDFVYGGGVTHIYEQNQMFLYFIYAMFLLAAIKLNRNFLACVLILALTGVHYYINTHPPYGEVFHVFMGKGAETIFASIFLYRAISNDAIVTPLERPLYAFIAFYTYAHGVMFSYKLINDTSFCNWYLEGKGGITNDFVRISNQLSMPLNEVAFYYFLYGVTFFVLTFFLYKYKNSIFFILGGKSY